MLQEVIGFGGYFCLIGWLLVFGFFLFFVFWLGWSEKTFMKRWALHDLNDESNTKF